MCGVSESIQPAKSIDRLALVLAPIALIVLLTVFSGWTGQGQASAISETTWILITSAPVAGAWIAAAIGLGLPLRHWLARGARDGLCIQMALGIASLMTLDATLGAVGFLQSVWAAWAIIGVGITIAALQFSHWMRSQRGLAPPDWLNWTCLPPVAVLLVASCSAPGWLWSSEFGGFDALSYHLQLPKEWNHLGRIQGLEHNVYSFLPSYVEAAFYHLTILRGNEVESAFACQFLHAGFALLSAVTIYRFAARLAGPVAGAVSAVVFVSTPWSIVVGSLAYNEMAVIMMLSAGLLVIADNGIGWWRRGALIGVLSGAACGAKLTAVGMTAAPLFALLLLTTSRRSLIIALATAATGAIITLSPYLIRNAIEAGNPVFPFATQIFGLAHWNQEQVEIWSLGHRADLPMPSRFHALWDQFLRYGIGTNPDPTEPWKPQWAIVPWVFLASLVGLASKGLRKWSALLVVVFAIQILFWLGFTHLKSRFILPAVVPMAMAIGIVVRLLVHQRVVASVALVGLVGFVVFIFASERDGAPAAAVGSARLLSGEMLSAEDRAKIGATTLPAVAINYLLPEHSKTLLIGDAKPFYYRIERIAYQTTWDRGVLSRLMREYPDEPAQWASQLRELGFTHCLVDEEMLRRWEEARWNDPLLTAERVGNFVESHARVVFRYSDDLALYELIPTP